jgi:hypothetical protein
MSHRRVVGVGAVVVVGLAVLLATVIVNGQDSEPAVETSVSPTAWGDPDLQGVWRNETTTPLQRPADVEGRALLTNEEVAARQADVREREARLVAGADGVEVGRRPLDESPIRGNEYNRNWQFTGSPEVVLNRTSLITDPPDGQIQYTPEARRRSEIARDRYGVGPYYTFRDPDTGERCITDGLPGNMWSGTAGAPTQIVQSPGYVVILHETYGDDRRIIPTDGHPHGTIREWFGESVGRWEDETLVVETINFADKTKGSWWNSIWREPTETMRIVERFTRIDPDTLDYQLTIEDPAKFTQAWTVDVPLTKLSQPRFEYACHEGNYAMVNTLSAARNVEKAAEEARRGAR